MPEEVDSMDVWKDRVQQELNSLNQKQQQSEEKLNGVVTDVHKLQVTEQLQDQKIGNLEKAFSEIKDDLNWIKRKITGAIISAVIVAVVGGVVGVAVANIYGG